VPVVTLACHAMATRFEVALHGQNPVALRAAGEEALAEIERLENRLSLFRPGSEISEVNARAAGQSVRVTPEVFALLLRARDLHQATEGAFDITIAPLVRCWGFLGGQGRVPVPQELAETRACVGMHLVQLDAANFSVRFARHGVMLDLGAIGKGYAIERAADLLREAGVESALLHGGTSTVYGLGHPPNAESWGVAVTAPIEPGQTGSGTPPASATTIVKLESGSEDHAAPGRVLAVVPLKDEALSVSAVWGKFFKTGGRTFGHIIDPRDGYPADRAILAAVAHASATETDALSTALLTVGLEGHDALGQLRPGMRTLVVGDSGATRAQGITVAATVR
jgi:thiamine biosynthesis lipoprotein